ncbi:hypothetical protein IAU60_003484 [Kwoniella sp. DSM 27419]
MSLPLATLSSLLAMQDVEDHKPRLSKISWLPDIFVFRSSILPIVLGPVLTVTIFSAFVAAVSLTWGKEVGLTNNVVPLLSVVVGLLLVFRNSSAYERYAEGRKDFTTLISIARNLSRNIWVTVALPPATPDGGPSITRQQLTAEKKKLVRLVVAFVMATKHHLRAEGGIHHEDLRGLLPPQLAGNDIHRLRPSASYTKLAGEPVSTARDIIASPQSMTPVLPSGWPDEEAHLGIEGVPSSGPISASPSVSSVISPSNSTFTSYGGGLHNRAKRPVGKSRPTAVRVRLDAERRDTAMRSARGTHNMSSPRDERAPLIKKGVKPDPLTSVGLVHRAENGLGSVVELGLPLIIAHEIGRGIFRLRRMGCLEAVGPAGMNALQSAVSAMTDQLGSMERIVQTPLPYIFCVHLKQVVSLYLFILPFVLVDSMGWKMVFIMFCISTTFMGIEGIAAMIEMPFGTDPSDLNLDLYCTELLCECEAILEGLPEGDQDDSPVFGQCTEPDDYGADDDGGD